MDQASDLRQLVRQDPGHTRSAADAPHLVAVASGKGGVGTTTVAVNLAVALTKLGRRVVLVDADFDGADVSNCYQVNSEYTVVDVLRGSRSIHEVLCRGPAGVQVLPGDWSGETPADCTPMAQERLIAALRTLGLHADDVILDVGSGVSRVNRRFWHASDKVLVVTTPEDAAVMNAYAAVKLLCEGDPQLPVFSLINLAGDAADAAAVHERLARACQRFLGLHLFAGGYLPAATAVLSAVRSQQPFVLQAPSCEATRQMELLAERMIAPRSQPPAPRMLERLLSRKTQRSSQNN